MRLGLGIRSLPTTSTVLQGMPAILPCSFRFMCTGTRPTPWFVQPQMQVARMKITDHTSAWCQSDINLGEFSMSPTSKNPKAYFGGWSAHSSESFWKPFFLGSFMRQFCSHIVLYGCTFIILYHHCSLCTASSSHPQHSTPHPCQATSWHPHNWSSSAAKNFWRHVWWPCSQGVRGGFCLILWLNSFGPWCSRWRRMVVKADTYEE